MAPRRKPFGASDVAADLARLTGVGSAPASRDGGGRSPKDAYAPPSIAPCAYGSLADLPPLEPRREDETPEQRRTALQTRTQLAMAAGVDPAVIAQAATPLPGRQNPTRAHPTKRKVTFETTREVCFPAHTFTPLTLSEFTNCGVSHVPFFEYVVEWLAATGHLVVFTGANAISVYPTTASPAHVHALDDVIGHENEWGTPRSSSHPRSWSEEVGWAVGGVRVLHTAYENGHFPKSGSTFSAKFSSGESAAMTSYQLCATTMTRTQLRLSSPHFRAAYQRFVERTTARNSRNFVHRRGRGDVVLFITFQADMCHPFADYSPEDFEATSVRNVQFVLSDPLAHVEAMGRSGVASQRDVRDLLRAWRATEVIGDSPKEPRLPNGGLVPLWDDAYEAERDAAVRAHKEWRATVTDIATHPDAARFDAQREAWIDELIMYNQCLEKSAHTHETKEQKAKERPTHHTARSRGNRRGGKNGERGQGNRKSQPR